MKKQCVSGWTAQTFLVDVEETEIQTERGRWVPGVVATCQKCGHETKAFGTEEPSINFCLYTMGQECPQGLSNFYEVFDPEEEQRIRLLQEQSQADAPDYGYRRSTSRIPAGDTCAVPKCVRKRQPGRSVCWNCAYGSTGRSERQLPGTRSPIYEQICVRKCDIERLWNVKHEIKQ
jgi:hypothetical protein